MIRDFASRQWAALDKALLDAAANNGIQHYGISTRWAGNAIIVYADTLDDTKPTVLCLHFGRWIGEIQKMPIRDVVASLSREQGAE